MSGLGPLPLIVNAEIFLPEARSLAASVAISFNWCCGLAVTKLSGGLESEWGRCAPFLAYGSVCLLGTGVFLLFLPETRGRSPGEIAERFKLGKRRTDGINNK